MLIIVLWNVWKEQDGFDDHATKVYKRGSKRFVSSQSTFSSTTTFINTYLGTLKNCTRDFDTKIFVNYQH
jgi:hypothetical protein